MLKFATSKKIFSVAALVSVSLTGCCTDQAAKVRKDRDITLGVWGAGFRPNANSGLVANLNGAVGEENQESKIKGDTVAAPDGTLGRKYSTATRQYDFAYHIYPSQKSAFYYGLGTQYLDRTTSFGGLTTSSSLANPETTSISVNDKTVGVGPSVGWDWIWENGFSVFLDTALRIPVKSQRKTIDDGTDGNINVTDRDATQSKIDKAVSGSSILSARLILGYSF